MPDEDPVEVMGLRFPNTIGLAAGMDKDGIRVNAFGALGFGHVEIGTITPLAQPGNPKPRQPRATMCVPTPTATCSTAAFTPISKSD